MNALPAHVPTPSVPSTVLRDAKRTASGGSMFIEHLGDPEPTQDELEAFDCLYDPFLNARRLSQDASGLRSPPLSPRLPLSESLSNGILPSLVRKLSQSASSKRPKGPDGRRASRIESSGKTAGNEDERIGWSPKLAKEHPSPRPPRRTRSGGRGQGTGHLSRPSINGSRRISFADDGNTSFGRLDESFSQSEADDIEASLNNFSAKRFSMPDIHPHTGFQPHQYQRDSSGHPGFRAQHSPAEERRMSFEVIRGPQASPSAPRMSFNQMRSASPLANSQNAYQRRPTSPLASPSNPFSHFSLGNVLSKSTSSTSTASSTVFEPAPGSGFLPHPPTRPSPRRSLSASIVSLGKIVANLSSRSNSSHSKDSSIPEVSSAASPSFKVNVVYRMDPASPASAGSRASLSLSGNASPRPSSPLVTIPPILAEEEGLSTSVPLLKPSFVVESRPALVRNAKSDDGQHKSPGKQNRTFSPLRQTIRPGGDLLSPVRALQSQQAASSIPSTGIDEVDEREESEDWLASLRGRPQNRRLSAADLFAPHSTPVRQLAASRSSSSSSSSASGTASPLITSPVEEEDGLDFSKKPIRMTSVDELPLHEATTNVAFAEQRSNRQRTTSYSSLLSASRPTTPGSAPALRPFPQLPSSPSPSAGVRTQPAHRYTQSSPAMTLAAEMVQLSSPGPAGGEASVLNASHAKFAAVLTAAAAASATSPKSPSVIIRDRQQIKGTMSRRSVENAIDDTSDEEDVPDDFSAQKQMKNLDESLSADARLPKLSYGTASSTGNDKALHRFDILRPGSAPPPKIRSSSTSVAVPRQPIFSKTGSKQSSRCSSIINSPHSSSKNAFDGLFDKEGSTQVDGLSAVRMAGARRGDNKSEDSQMTVLSNESAAGEGEEDVFQPKMPVW